MADIRSGQLDTDSRRRALGALVYCYRNRVRPEGAFEILLDNLNAPDRPLNLIGTLARGYDANSILVVEPFKALLLKELLTLRDGDAEAIAEFLTIFSVADSEFAKALDELHVGQQLSRYARLAAILPRLSATEPEEWGNYLEGLTYLTKTDKLEILCYFWMWKGNFDKFMLLNQAQQAILRDLTLRHLAEDLQDFETMDRKEVWIYWMGFRRMVGRYHGPVALPRHIVLPSGVSAYALEGIDQDCLKSLAEIREAAPAGSRKSEFVEGLLAELAKK